jgi:hypothetical protein
MKFVLYALPALLVAAASAQPFTQCPPSTFDGSTFSGCDKLVIITSSSSATIAADPTQPVVKGDGDRIVGVQNNSGTSVHAIRLIGSASGSGTGAFAFDGSASGETVQVTCPVANPGVTGYEVGGVTFTNLATTVTACDTGTVNFNPPIAPGGSAYFFLERSPDAVIFVNEPVAPQPGAVPIPPSILLSLTGLALAAIFCLLQGRLTRA